MSQSKVRLLGAVINLALAVDHGDGGDLEPLNTDPIQLSRKAFREFASERLDALSLRVRSDRRGRPAR